MQNRMILTTLYTTIRDTTVADAAERAQEDTNCDDKTAAGAPRSGFDKDTNHDYNNHDL